MRWTLINRLGGMGNRTILLVMLYFFLFIGYGARGRTVLSLARCFKGKGQA